MTDLFAARSLMALSLAFHIVFAVVGIAMPLLMVLAEARWRRTGDGMWLQRYREWRAADRSNIVRFTDGLVRVFSQPLGPIKLLRNAGMLAFDLMPAAKDALSQLSLGAAGRVPRLARGAPLK